MYNALSGQVWRGNEKGIDYKSLQAAGVDKHDPALKQLLLLTRQLYGFPRHLSQHSGGFVIVRDRLDKICVIRPAAMAGRSIIEWDKDDIDALGLLKIDVLALGMLSCLAGAFHLMQRHYHRPIGLASIPPEDKQTYDMLCRGESVGVFQVESRAQMAMVRRAFSRVPFMIWSYRLRLSGEALSRGYGTSLFAAARRAGICQLSF